MTQLDPSGRPGSGGRPHGAEPAGAEPAGPEPAGPEPPGGDRSAPGAPAPVILQIRLPSWLRPGRRPSLLLVVALLMIAAQLVWKAGVLGESYFSNDDFIYFSRAAVADFDLEYLMQPYFGQLMPGVFALCWALVRISAYDWPLTAAILLALQAGAGLAMLRLLRLLFGDRRIILLPLALYLVTPLTVPAFAWFASSTQSLPLQIALLMALGSHVRYLRGDGRAHAWWGLAWTVFGMAFFAKAAAIPLVAFLLTAAYFTPGSILPALVRAARAHLRVWLAYAAVVGAYLVTYALVSVPAPGALGELSVGNAARFARRLILDTFLTGAAGGPLRWYPFGPNDAMAVPRPAMQAVAWIAFAAVILATLLYRRRAWRAWAILAVYLLVADVAPVVFGRAGDLVLNGYLTRYVADAAPVLAICLAIALFPLAGEAEPAAGAGEAVSRPAPYRRPRPSPTALHSLTGIALACFVIASVVSVDAYTAGLGGTRIRAYVDNARAALAAAPPTAQIFPTPVPDHVMGALFKADRSAPLVLAPLARPGVAAAMRRPKATHDPMIFDEQGRLRPMLVFGPVSAPPRGRCFAKVGDAVRVPLNAPGGFGRAATISYRASGPARITAHIGREVIPVDLAQGVWLVHFPVHSAADALFVTMRTPGVDVCVLGVAEGVPVVRR